MEKVIWLLEKNVFLDNHDKIIEVLNNNNVDYCPCDYIPFGVGLNYDKSKVEDKNIFFYGSLQGAKWAKENLPNVNVFCNLDQLECINYYPIFRGLLFQENYIFLPLIEAYTRKDWILKHIAKEGQFFIRPSNGFKTFTGQLISEETWEQDFKEVLRYDPPDNLICVVSEPRNILDETRFIVGSDGIITYSRYKSEDDTINQNIIDFANKVIEDVDYNPDPIWVLDIAGTETELSVMEVGGLSCSGYYNCDIDSIVKSINNVLVQDKENE